MWACLLVKMYNATAPWNWLPSLSPRKPNCVAQHTNVQAQSTHFRHGPKSQMGPRVSRQIAWTANTTPLHTNTTELMLTGTSPNWTTHGALVSLQSLAGSSPLYPAWLNSDWKTKHKMPEKVVSGRLVLGSAPGIYCDLSKL